MTRLSAKRTTAPWTWRTAAEKADLVDQLITAAKRSKSDPVAAIYQKLPTLTRGTDPLPRAVAAELAQLAVAALQGVEKADEPDRRAILKIKERPPGKKASDDEKASYEARDELGGIALNIVNDDDEVIASARMHASDFGAQYFRNNLSALYAYAKETVRLPERRKEQEDSDEEQILSGEERYKKFLKVLGPLDSALTEALVT